MPLSAPEPLSVAHDVSGFSCGKPILDHWLKTRALANQEKGFTAVLVVHNAGRVVILRPRADCRCAYRAAALDPHGATARSGPCLLLGQLATDKEWAGQGIGTGLVKHALERCVKAAALIGGRALMVNAVDDDAVRFWQRRGFTRSKDDPLVLFRSIADVAASLAKAQ